MVVGREEDRRGLIGIFDPFTRAAIRPTVFFDALPFAAMTI